MLGPVRGTQILTRVGGEKGSDPDFGRRRGSADLLRQRRRVGLREALHQLVDRRAGRGQLLVQRAQPVVRLLHDAEPLTQLLEALVGGRAGLLETLGDRKSTRLNSSHVKISYA